MNNNTSPWYVHFVVTVVLAYVLLVIMVMTFLPVEVLTSVWTHSLILVLGLFGIWFWDPMTESFRKIGEWLLNLNSNSRG